MLGPTKGTVAFAMVNDSFGDGFADSGQRFQFLGRSRIYVYRIDRGRIGSIKLKANCCLGISCLRSTGDSQQSETNGEQDAD